MGQKDQATQIEEAAAMIAAARDMVVFTGAGVSTESGIPDFRSPGGLWSRFDPDDFTIEKFLYSAQTRRKQWHILLSGGLLQEAEPNAAHHAIAELEKLGKLSCVVTQNIDNLHQKAGSSPQRVFELHGTLQRLICLDCHAGFPLETILARHGGSADMPACETCGGLLKPDVIFFGEALPQQALNEALHYAGLCGLLLVVGSSLLVYPAASIPQFAREAGAKLLIVNRTPTPYDGAADLVIHGSAGEVMTGILKALKRRMV